MARFDRLARFDALALASLVWFLAKFLRYAFPPLFGTLEGTYDVSRTTLGAAFTGFMLVYALMQFPSGLLADRLGSVKVVVAGALLASAGALVLVVDSPFLVLAVGMVLMGAGTGAHKTVSVRLLSRVYPGRTGRALGVFDTAGTFGGVAAPAAVVVALAAPEVFGAGWRTLFLAGGLAGVGLALAFLARVPARLRASEEVEPSVESETDASPWTYVAMFADPRFSAFVGVTVLFSFAYNGAVAFLPLFLTEEAGLAAATANLLFSALFVVSLVQLVTGEASDRVGSLPVLTLTLGLASAGLLATLLPADLASPAVLSVAVVCLGLGAHGYRPVRGAYLTSIVPASVAGGSLGVVRTLLMGSGAIAPAVVGYLSETAGFRPAFWLLAAALVSATCLCGLLWLLDR
jgi:MFS family permease